MTHGYGDGDGGGGGAKELLMNDATKKGEQISDVRKKNKKKKKHVMVSNSKVCSKQPPAPQVRPLLIPDASDVRL